MGSRNSGLFLLSAILIFFLLQKPIIARLQSKSSLQKLTVPSKKTYIVYLGAHAHGPQPSLEDYERATDSHHELLGSFLGSKDIARDSIIYSYNKYINGFAATLEEEEAQRISRHPKVVSVFETKVKVLHTTRSWSFMGLERDNNIPESSLWTKARFGEDAIIANIDTGAWPESRSFDDEGMGPIPSRWKGECQKDKENGVTCNRKLIGARSFYKGVVAAVGHAPPPNETSPRDYIGHGTHTLSTAAGNFVPGASVLGNANGTAKGGSPGARAAAYKVCWGEFCTDADILAAFDAAIADGVDVISVSIGASPVDYAQDVVAIGSFHAAVEGIAVVCSAGNSGPSTGSVTNLAPWVITVGASSIDRDFGLTFALGNKKQFQGKSQSLQSLEVGKSYPLINSVDVKVDGDVVSDDLARQCAEGTLDTEKTKGKVVVCEFGTGTLPLEFHLEIGDEGAAAILIDPGTLGDYFLLDAYSKPHAVISASDGVALRSYMNSTKSPVISFSRPNTLLGTKPAPKMAFYSSVGPNTISRAIMKPDITAPGSSILASYSEAVPPSDDLSDPTRVPFNILTGTSMSCPHVSGVVGLLKTLHPDWSPAAIKSAIMTTARTHDNTGRLMENCMRNESTPLYSGSGHIRPNRAMDPGLVYDLTHRDYLDFLCSIGYKAEEMSYFQNYTCPSEYKQLEDFNYPAITFPYLRQQPQTATRRLKNVGTPGKYRVRHQAPAGFEVAVKPEVLTFGEVGEEKEFNVTVGAAPRGSINRGYNFGWLLWSDGKHSVRSPLLINAIA